tara:strand:+ start:572 stop:736 length:165 start_codon:yes stop_codon:yes gene_type:complete
MIINKNQKLTCLLCGRDKFIRKTPHKCLGGYRKRGLKWGIKTPNGIWKFKNKTR